MINGPGTGSVDTEVGGSASLEQSIGIAWWQRYVPLGGGLAGIGLAGSGELLVQLNNSSHLSLILYLLGIVIFAISARSLPPASSDMPANEVATDLPEPTQRRRVWAIMVGGTVLAVMITLSALSLLRAELGSIPGAYLWLTGLLILVATGIVLRHKQGWSARWRGGVWPQDRRARWILILTIVVTLTVASAARLLLLDKVPWGINADEGDRAALSIQIVRGDNTQSIFETGWYWISMVYFWVLAQVMKVVGLSFVGARVLGALASIVSVGVVTWIGIRHFNMRVGLLAGAILSMLAISLQFARETSEAGPTATLWATSVALFLEAARRGRTWAWVCAGVTGAFAIYFYPSGRLWAVVAVVFCLYLLVHGLGGKRFGILRGTVLAALAAIMVAGPFLLLGSQRPEILTGRAEQTSIFTQNNFVRLNYYRPEWSTAELLVEQTIRTVGIFNQFSDNGGFWPTDRPLMPGPLSVLTFLGLGWCCLHLRDPRYVILATWFWIGITGTIVTVETPNVQRMATAIPVLGLFIALVLDSTVRRFEVAFVGNRSENQRVRRWAASLATGATILATVYFMWAQGRFYFVDYAQMDRWHGPTTLGLAVNEQGTDTLVTTVGMQYHMVNAGWVRLLAPYTPRGGIKDPGNDLPLVQPTTNNLAFIIFPRFEQYLPYLKRIYPRGGMQRYEHPTEGLNFTMYKVPKEQLRGMQGAIVEPPTGMGEAARVGTIGEAPPGWTSFPSEMKWTAGLTAPRYWNYVFQIGPGPARLKVDGQEILVLSKGTEVVSTTVWLARGDHAIEYNGVVKGPNQSALFKWGIMPEVRGAEAPLPDFQMPSPEELKTEQTKPVGLYGTVQVTGRPEQRRIDRTLANCCLSSQVRSDGLPYTVNWTGTLEAPVTGTYSMTLMAQGLATLQLDGRRVIVNSAPSEQPIGGSVELAKGTHSVEITFQVESGPGGIEWVWTPPGAEREIVPPSALSPPPGVTVGKAIPLEQLGALEFQPVVPALETVK